MCAGVWRATRDRILAHQRGARAPIWRADGARHRGGNTPARAANALNPRDVRAPARTSRALVCFLQSNSRYQSDAWGRRPGRPRDTMRTVLVDAEPDPIAIDARRTAVVIIDMQRDFLEPGGFGETLGNDVSLLHAAVAPCRALLEAARADGDARRPHARGPPAGPVRRAARQGRARRAVAAHRRTRPDGPHPDPRRAGPRHRSRAGAAARRAGRRQARQGRVLRDRPARDPAATAASRR